MTATLSVDQLLNLARVYSAATGRTLGGVGKRAINNHHFFIRLARGHGGNTESVARVTKWFFENWPDNAEWPKGMPDKPQQSIPMEQQTPKWRPGRPPKLKAGRTEPAELLPHPLRRYRARQNLTMRELGEMAGGLVESEISRIETGSRGLPSCAVILALARATAYEVSEIDIFRWHFHHATGRQVSQAAPSNYREAARMESEFLELSSIDDGSGKPKLRLRVDRVLDWQLATEIFQMIGPLKRTDGDQRDTTDNASVALREQV